jgi:hypothetical protein
VSSRTALFATGETLRIAYAEFTPLITFHPGSKLTVRIVAGLNSGFADTVEYEAVAVREGLVILSWREHIGSTIVHVLDLDAKLAYTVVAPAKGDLMRLRGPIHRVSSIAAAVGRPPKRVLAGPGRFAQYHGVPDYAAY